MNPNQPRERDEARIFNEVAGRFDAPAYVRRGQKVTHAFEDLLARCRKVRKDYLEMPRLRLGQLRAMAGSWASLVTLLHNEQQVEILDTLHEGLQPTLRAPLAPTQSQRALRQALEELCDSLQRFNARWLAFLDKQDLTAINTLREGYNRWYVLEKECAVRSASIARAGFRPLPPLTVAEILEHLPLLPVPALP